MAFFSGLFSCFMTSTRVCDDANKSKSSYANTKKKSSSKAPIPVSYFPINSQVSRL
ncbi:hypothetical protein R3W88_002002 [Solanum pinnatisectum]|uniref:Uncharacterized protein n=1 Tax=Solanum pinnatisectum TaxID=50273 RepID=A0AAV9MN66_9SOLN|nr:hypothetical protein R3W88_002002 [Solanum pinnatisectum]